MKTHLKLRRDFQEPEDTGTLKFPVQPATPPAQARGLPRPRLVGAEPSSDSDVISSDDLVRQIESTLDRMQSRLDKFKRQLNHDMKFPVQSDEPPPRTAA